MYVNRLDLLGGTLRSSLRAEARPSRADRLDLVFGDVQFQLGPLKFTQASLQRKLPGLPLMSARTGVWPPLRSCGSRRALSCQRRRAPLVDAVPL